MVSTESRRTSGERGEGDRADIIAGYGCHAVVFTVDRLTRVVGLLAGLWTSPLDVHRGRERKSLDSQGRHFPVLKSKVTCMHTESLTGSFAFFESDFSVSSKEPDKTSSPDVLPLDRVWTPRLPPQSSPQYRHLHLVLPWHVHAICALQIAAMYRGSTAEL
jgi:hypothetical protein